MAENSNGSTSTVHSRANASVRSRALGRIPSTLQALNSFKTEDRRSALAEAVNSFDEGLVVRPQDTGWVNALARTFFSYSIDNFSPARLAWEAVIRGLSVVGCADLDNLGALGEMQTAGDALGIRVTVSMETLAQVQSYCDSDLNVPGHPGLLRAMGVGFTAVPPLDSDHGRLIASLPVRARERNLALLAKVNTFLAPVTIDFEADVAPLTPAGNATPEHLAAAYFNKAKAIFPELQDLAVFWSDVLGRSPQDAECLLGDDANFKEVVLDKILRLGDEPPQVSALPGVTEFFQAVRQSGAIPCLYWLNGESAGEVDPGRLLDDAVNWGARAVALTPDACWNLPDPEIKERRLASLASLMAAAKARNLPVLAGSPMSAPRQKFVDSFDAPELAAYFRDFTDSAFWLYGHATLQRAAGMGRVSEWADHHFGRDRAAANAFYTAVGKKAAPGKATRTRIASSCPDGDPGDILEALAPLKI